MEERDALDAVLADLGDVLEELVSGYRLHARYVEETQRARWLSARGQALAAKLDDIEYRLLKETYTKVRACVLLPTRWKPAGADEPGALGWVFSQETIPALRQIHKALRQELATATAAHDKAATRLASYESVEDTLVGIAAEYAATQEELKQRMWTISQLERDINAQR